MIYRERVAWQVILSLVYNLECKTHCLWAVGSSLKGIASSSDGRRKSEIIVAFSRQYCSEMRINMRKSLAYYHLPGLFSFYEFYRVFLALYRQHREYFYDWCEIGSIYGAPMDCLWGGGRVEEGATDPRRVLALVQEYGISARLTFSNSLLREEHLADPSCNRLCRLFSESFESACASEAFKDAYENKIIDVNKVIDRNKASRDKRPSNGAIVHSELLTEYLRRKYPGLYLVSSTTKVLKEFSDFEREAKREEFRYIVPDFRLNKSTEKMKRLEQSTKDKVEFLCNECCDIGCKERRQCYQAVSLRNLGEAECMTASAASHRCHAPGASQGYRFSKAMRNPSFISIEDIQNVYLPEGFSNFKIEGRGLGSALLLEFLLYYMTKPAYQLVVREEIYLENTLDLF